MQQAARQAHERFTLQLSLAAPLGELADWLERAEIGERAVYATGFVLPQGHESVKQVQAWAAAGLVHPVQQRDPDDKRRWQWLIEKSSGQLPVRRCEGVRNGARGDAIARTGVGGRVPSRASSRPDLTREQMRCLHRFIAKAAVAGEECPSLAEMARHVMALSPRASVDRRKRNRVNYLLARLEGEGSIARTRGSATVRPVITILTGRGRGKSTKGNEG